MSNNLIKKMKTKQPILLLFSIFIITNTMFTGCFLVKKMAGADIDPVQFEKARQAKMLETRMLASSELSNRLTKNDPLDNADITFFLDESLIKKIAKQYEGSTGWLDGSTSYNVDSVDINLLNGSALAEVMLKAHNDKYNVDVEMKLDCIVTFSLEKNELVTHLEPFNISPAVITRGLLASADELIANLIKINVANLGKNFPPLKYPISFANKVNIQGNTINIKDKINLSIYNPNRTLNYKLKLKEVLIFEGRAFVALNIESVEVK
jgi:hypothetical protein